MPNTPWFSEIELPFAVQADVAFHEIVAVDINGDGYDDLIASVFRYPLVDAGAPMLILLGGPDGTLQAAPADFVTGGMPSNVHGRGLLVADFNGDGKPDFFVADHGYDAPPFPGAQNTLLLSNSSGGLTNATATLPQLTDYSHSAAVGDFDNDGDIDVFVNNYNEPSYLLINNGAGNFTMAPMPAPPNQQFYNSPATIAYDFDADGDLDLLLSPNFSDAEGVRLLLNDGHANFSFASQPAFTITPYGVQDTVVDMAATDINGDGLTDFIVSIARDQYAGGGRIGIYINQGNGTFADETDLRVDDPNSADWIDRNRLIDVNGDGLIDIVQIAPGGRKSPILLNTGDGHYVRLVTDFSENFDALIGSYEFDRMIPGDFNGDGRIDFAGDHYRVGDTDHWGVHLRKDAGLALTGTPLDNSLLGDDSDETLSGLAGNDILAGAAGNDVLIGGLGADFLFGGAGIDTASYAGDEGGVFVNLTLGRGYGNASFGDTFNSIENVIGTDYDDFLIGDPGVNRLDGAAGNDTIIGAVGADVLIGGEGIDLLSFEDNSGTVFVNLLTGQGFNNAAQGDTFSGFENVIGGLFDDTLIGDDGANRLDGAFGADTLVGNGGADTFVLRYAPGVASGFDNPFSSANVDTIFDFVSGEDKLEVSATAFGGGLAAGSLAAGAFVLGTAAADADDRFIYDQANGKLYFDADGNGAGAQVLMTLLPNHNSIAASDFVVV